MLSTDTLVRASFFPAQVRLPDGTTWRQVRVYATTEGLAVYRRPAADDEPDWHSPIDYAATQRPVNLHAGAGWDVHTDAGLVVVSVLGGCGCSNPLKGWAPAWGESMADRWS